LGKYEEECGETSAAESLEQYRVAMTENTKDDDKFASPDALPLFLFNYGFDVWINSNRGTVFNQKHTKDTANARYIDSSPAEFWDFNWSTMATKDIPAVIEYVLGATEKERLSYVGYSMGSAQIYQALASGTKDADLQKTLDKIDTVVALAACPYGPGAVTDADKQAENRASIQSYLTKWENSGLNYAFGDYG
jgi:pimeloyl-ACP methyl ester carboxylesterase